MPCFYIRVEKNSNLSVYYKIIITKLKEIDCLQLVWLGKKTSFHNSSSSSIVHTYFIVTISSQVGRAAWERQRGYWYTQSLPHSKHCAWALCFLAQCDSCSAMRQLQKQTVILPLAAWIDSVLKAHRVLYITAPGLGARPAGWKL